MHEVNLGHVYVIEDENGFVKIGVATNVAKRLKSINTSSAYKIVNTYKSPSCVTPYKIEKAAHLHFSNNNKKGEWFSISFLDAVNFVKKHFSEPLPYCQSESRTVIELSPEVEIFIMARVRDEVKNVLAKPSETESNPVTPINDWVDNCTIFDPNAITYVGTAKKVNGHYVNSDTLLYPSFCEYCLSLKIVPISGRRFSNLLKILLYSLDNNSIYKTKGCKGMRYAGIAIKKKS